MPIDVLMPQLSPTMTEGRLAGWSVKEGDSVSAGDVIAEVETDKATMEVEATDDGIIHSIIGKAGVEIQVGTPIAVLKEEGETVAKDYTPASQAAAPAVDEKAEEAPTAEVKPATVTPAAKAVKPALPKMTAVSSPANTGRVKASPVARKIAQQRGIDLGAVQGSGPGGRIVKSDVDGAVVLNAGGSMPMALQAAKPLNATVEPHTMMRKTIANRLVEAKQSVPHFYLTVDVEMDALNEARAQLNNMAGKDESGKPVYKISVNDFIIKASSLALRAHPDANASWSDEGLVRHGSVDVSVAVAIEGGLITPILTNSDEKSIVSLSTEMKELAGLARAGKLAPEQYQGGTFSVSNLGMYGIKHFDAIINPPQSCILACGVAEERPVVRDGGLDVASVMTMTMSVDHRVVDGALGAELIGKIKFYLENPVTMFA
jgi:pyruvate dehydrogenase E2 component (dihydrolipoamide acetyltransferase)